MPPGVPTASRSPRVLGVKLYTLQSLEICFIEKKKNYKTMLRTRKLYYSYLITFGS